MEQLQDLVNRLEKVATKFENFQGAVHSPGPVAGAGGSAAPASATSSNAKDSPGAFQKLLDETITSIIHAGGKLGKEGVIWTQENQNNIVGITDLLKNAFEAEKNVVEAMDHCRKPSQEELRKLVQPLNDFMTAANDNLKGRRTELFNHYSFVAECLNSLTWVVLTGEGAEKPPLHIKQCWQSSEFYANKILKEFRVADVSHVEWVNAIKKLVLGMSTYCTQFHMKTPTWKEGGISVSEYLGSDPPAESAPPPEPKKAPAKKPAPPELPVEQEPAPLNVHPTRSWQPPVDRPTPAQLVAGALDAKKKGLKKVTDAEKSKNQPQRTGLVPVKLRSTESEQSVKLGKTELLMERKWNVENHKGNKDIVLDKVNPRQVVYIFKCEDCIVKVQGKVNAITIDSCKKVGLLFETVMASVEIVNSSGIDMQSTGHLGTLAVDKCDGVKAFVPETSMDVEITTAKSSGVIVTITGGEEAQESAVPDQYISRFEDGKLVTKPAEHAGA